MEKDILTSSFMDLQSKLHRIALNYLHSDEDAQDALQDTYIRLLDKGNIVSSAQARNKLVAVLRHLCIDRLRRHRTFSLDSAEVTEAMQDEPEVEDISKLESLLQADLTKLQRRIYHLVIHEHLEYEEIADKLDMRVEAVRMNMSRVRRKIQDTYKALNK